MSLVSTASEGRRGGVAEFVSNNKCKWGGGFIKITKEHLLIITYPGNVKKLKKPKKFKMSYKKAKTYTTNAIVS